MDRANTPLLFSPQQYTAVKKKTEDLEGFHLDWATAVAIGGDEMDRIAESGKDGDVWSPSTIWHQCGALIEKYEIKLFRDCLSDAQDVWTADIASGPEASGKTPLIAICRAVVAYEIGDTISCPELYQEVRAEQ